MDYCWNCGTEIELGCMKYAPDEYGRPFYPVCPDCYREEHERQKRIPASILYGRPRALAEGHA